MIGPNDPVVSGDKAVGNLTKSSVQKDKSDQLLKHTSGSNYTGSTALQSEHVSKQSAGTDALDKLAQKNQPTTYQDIPFLVSDDLPQQTSAHPKSLIVKVFRGDSNPYATQTKRYVLNNDGSTVNTQGNKNKSYVSEEGALKPSNPQSSDYATDETIGSGIDPILHVSGYADGLANHSLYTSFTTDVSTATSYAEKNGSVITLDLGQLQDAIQRGDSDVAGVSVVTDRQLLGELYAERGASATTLRQVNQQIEDAEERVGQLKGDKKEADIEIGTAFKALNKGVKYKKLTETVVGKTIDLMNVGNLSKNERKLVQMKVEGKLIPSEAELSDESTIALAEQLRAMPDEAITSSFTAALSEKGVDSSDILNVINKHRTILRSIDTTNIKKQTLSALKGHLNAHVKALEHSLRTTSRDGEFLVKGTVPDRFVSVAGVSENIEANAISVERSGYSEDPVAASFTQHLKGLTDHFSKEYANGSKYDSLERTIDGEKMQAHRINHGITHSARQAMLVVDIIDTLRTVDPSSLAQPELAQWLQNIEREQGTQGINQLKEQLGVAAMYQRTGRESEVDRGEDANKYEQYIRASADLFASAAEGDELFSNERIQTIKDAINLPVDKDMHQLAAPSNDVEAFAIILESAHKLELQRIPTFFSEQRELVAVKLGFSAEEAMFPDTIVKLHSQAGKYIKASGIEMGRDLKREYTDDFIKLSNDPQRLMQILWQS